MSRRDDRKKRIRRSIKRMTSAPQPKKPVTPQGRILAGLNILRVLEDNAPQYLRDVLWYGPATFAKGDWASAVIWYRQKAPDSYKELTLFGVWVAESHDTTDILLGTKRLQFSAAVYNAEAYHAIIPQNFKTYYKDDGSPPDESRILYQTEYDVTRRLALRRELADEIIQWMRTRNH